MSLGAAASSFAGDRAANGMVLGAGSGALIGQAIGRNTEATLLGTAIGSVLGYIVGNEQEKIEAQPAYASYGYGEPAYYGNAPYYNGRRAYGPCREAEVLGTVDGEANRIRTLVCLDGNGRWVVNGTGQVVTEAPTVVYRQAPVAAYPAPWPVLNFSFGWIFGGGYDHGYRGYRGHDHGWRGGGDHWRGGNHWRGGYRHR